eukprot:TRINITY_DN7005_c0_g1_i1.p1 TRINITY_DN7005_c0_g1~~TRINITY_DN7005_c0_g1_i1.p1  ORF type:complete len:1810 (-),score=400.65 TRINITY_DN7005_c0_g1_i1:40-5469(-)
MATKLDQLFALLDSGTTAAARKAAAQQIGEIAKHHPYDLQNLLERAHIFLRNKNWNTRIAAGQAIEAISAAIPIWNPAEVKQDAAVKSEPSPDVSSGSVSDIGRFDFDGFDPLAVLRNGKLLLGSTGAEFVISKDQMDPRSLALQRKNIKEQLGEGFQFIGEIANDEDLMAVDSAPTKTEEIPSELQQKRSELEAMLSQKGISARQRNQARRKLKELDQSQDLSKSSLLAPSKALSASTGATKTLVTEQPQLGDKIVVESVVDVDRAFEDANEWPFERFCDELCNELFDAKWEVRHGAAVALREILKRHASAAGKRADAPKGEAQQQEQARAWRIDCALRLVCVLILDRFADYTSDETVAPVRETAAQALATLYAHMSVADLTRLVDIFMALQKQKEQWEVRHSVFLALKYMVSVRQDIIQPLLASNLLPRFMEGLQDAADDVKMAAADSLLQLVKTSATSIPADAINAIASIVWHTLLELDDITASTTSLMHLLAEIYAFTFPSVVLHAPPNNQALPLLAILVPRLFPFARHTVKSVRLATVNTCVRLLSSSTAPAAQWVAAIAADFLQLVFQNSILEEQDDIVSSTYSLWQALLPAALPSYSSGELTPLRNQISSWFTLAATPSGSPFDRRLVKNFSTNDSSGKLGVFDNQHSSAAPRIRAATFLAAFAFHASQSAPIMEIVWNHVYAMLNSNSASQKQSAALMLVEWAKLIPETGGEPQSFLPELIKQTLLANLEARTTKSDFYSELNKLIVDIRADTEALFQSFQNIGIPLSLAIPVSQMTPEQITELIGPNGFDALLPLVPPDPPRTAAPPPAATAKGKGKAAAAASTAAGSETQPTTQEKLTARRDRVRTALNYLEASQTELQIQVSDSISAAVVSMYILPEKLSPIINSHLKALKREQDLALQRRCAESLALLMYRIRSRSPSPNPAILKQILGLLAADLTDLVPPPEEEPQDGPPSTGEMPPAPKRRKLDSSAAAPETAASLESRLGRRGAEELLRALSTRFGSQLFDFLPSLWNEIASVSAVSDSLISILIIRALAPHLHESLRSEKLMSTIPLLITRISTCPSKGPVHFVASKALATVVQATMPDSMTSIIQLLLPVLQDASNATARVGAAIALREIVDALSIDILPFIIFLIIPILGRMSDQDDSVRRTVTFCFATLVKLLPLEAAIPNPPNMPAELVATRERERNFLMQLIGGGSKVDRFDLPIKINAQLRNYQQEGVNWLSFLNRYNLHGVLADDMGLGKTLQTLCVVASDDFHRRERFQADPVKNAESKQLPSLVVCPPTLIGHWHHEVKAYCDPTVFRSLEYAGQPFERRGLIPSFGNYQLIVTSYDIVRNDIEYFEKIAFNYCVLDEGHIIRNAKAKLTQAVKRIQANHRLILSGTPIQNSVLELWSLFDFLMPGFLGTEKQFTLQYVKPILASRDAKASSQDQERGVLAMETLHRQVLPFVLRRLKEDVLQDLPPKIIQDVPIDLSPLQVRLYDLASATSADSGDDKDKGKSKHIFQALQYLRKLCSHPKLVLNQAHPEYRTIMKELDSQGLTLDDISVAPKLVALRDLLLECGIGVTETGQDGGATPTINQHRVLIFCQLKQMIDIIEDDLFKKHMKTVTYMRLDGDVPQQQRVPLVEKFNSNPTIDVLMLTGRVGGLGLNLTGADTVIFMEHDWNPQADLQAMDRAHRLGAKKTVNVYRIITKGTLEDKIMSLQQFKLRIANAVVNKDNQSFANMDTSQLLDLFNYSGDASAKGATKKTEKKSSSVEDKMDAAMGAGIPKSLLTNLDELWDESQYAEEYNIDSFLSTLKK